MSRRIYASVAEKQKAYRERLNSQTEPRTAFSKPAIKRLSRPGRLQRIEDAVRTLAEEYTSWLSALPQNLAGSQAAERLELTIEELEAIADAISAIDPPRIGR
jgi:uncharacterized membrane protein YccC